MTGHCCVGFTKSGDTRTKVFYVFFFVDRYRESEQKLACSFPPPHVPARVCTERHSESTRPACALVPLSRAFYLTAHSVMAALGFLPSLCLSLSVVCLPAIGSLSLSLSLCLSFSVACVCVCPERGVPESLENPMVEITSRLPSLFLLPFIKSRGKQEGGRGHRVDPTIGRIRTAALRPSGCTYTFRHHLAVAFPHESCRFLHCG